MSPLVVERGWSGGSGNGRLRALLPGVHSRAIDGAHERGRCHPLLPADPETLGVSLKDFIETKLTPPAAD